MNKDVIHIGICVVIFVILRYLFSVVEVDTLLFLLAPVHKCVALFLNSSGSFVEGEGYYYPALQIIIGKSCSGFNFLLTCFLMTSFLFIQKKVIRSGLIIPVSFLLSYGLTLFANISRIISFLLLRQRGIFPAGSPDEDIYHTLTGVVIYLMILIFFYLVIQKHVLNIKSQSHEKVT